MRSNDETPLSSHATASPSMMIASADGLRPDNQG
jgi:hypothetical protein